MMTTLEVVFAVRELVDDRLSGRHKNVLFALASHRGVNGVISASSAQLSKATAESRATVYRALDDLVTWGYVRRSPRGRYTAPTYELVLPERASHGDPRGGPPGRAGRASRCADAGTGGGKDQIDRLQDSLVDFLIDAGVPSEVARATQSALRSQQAQTAIHKRVEREIEALVVSELAKRADEIEERVRGAINERLEEVVASTARRLLEDELEKVRRRFQ